VCYEAGARRQDKPASDASDLAVVPFRVVLEMFVLSVMLHGV